MRTTIRHDSTGRTLLAYLASHAEPLALARLTQYMELMHDMEPNNVRQALWYYVQVGSIRSVVRGWYQRRWEVVQ